MINPAEEIVNIWLQEFHDHFVMSNIVVPKSSRLNARGRKIGGGRGKEVDFFSTKENEEQKFIEALKNAKIKAISFGTVLKQIYDSLDYFGYDSTRQYVFLFKKMGYRPAD